MCQRLLIAFVLFLLPAASAAKSRTGAAVDAANAVKAEFAERNQPEARASEGVGISNRSLKAVVTAIHDYGTVVLESFEGEWLGTLDPRTIPVLIARDKSRFGGRKHLAASDLAVGHRLKITFRGNTSEILKVAVLKDRSS